jgi:anti-sigma factor RsiW
MKTVAYLIEEQDLHAYVDDRLSDARRKAVEAYLEEHEGAAAKVAAYRAQNDALRELSVAQLQPAPEIIRALGARLAVRVTQVAPLPWEKLRQKKRAYPSSR